MEPTNSSASRASSASSPATPATYRSGLTSTASDPVVACGSTTRDTGHRDSDVFELGLGARDDVDHRSGDCVDIGDVLFDHGVRRHGLHAVALNSEPVTAATQFEKFHGGRTYVDTQNRRSLALEEP